MFSIQEKIHFYYFQCIINETLIRICLNLVIESGFAYKWTEIFSHSTVFGSLDSNRWFFQNLPTFLGRTEDKVEHKN